MSIEIKHTAQEPSLTCLELLLDTSDDHETRTAILQAYNWLAEAHFSGAERNGPVARRLWKTMLEAIASKSNHNPSGAEVLGFDCIWAEIQSLKASHDASLTDASKHTDLEFRGLRLDSYTHYILQTLSSSRFAPFVSRLAAEQPQYFDRPSDIDERRQHDADFPALTDLLSPALHDEETAVSVVALMVHHIAYACDLFQRTNYDPSDETVQALLEWRVQQVSSMLAEPLSRMPLRARTHCAGMNVRGVQEFVVRRARELVVRSSAEELGWEMYTWFVGCVQRIVLGKSGLLIKMLEEYDLVPLMEPGAVPIAHFAPRVAARLCVPQELVAMWQHFDAGALEDVRFEAVGLEIDVRDVAELTAVPDPPTCSVCLEDLAARGSVQDAFEVGCGHSFHEACLVLMINGIEPNSNCCPLCRSKICEARERRRVVDHAEADGMHAGDARH